MGSSSEISDYGRRPLNALIDELALQDPDKELFSITDDAITFRKISQKNFRDAVNRTASFLENSLGYRSQSHEAIGYIGPADLRYHLLCFGAVRAGFTMVFASPRNSLEGHLKVLETANCNIYACPSPNLPGVESILSNRKMRIINLPALDRLLEGGQVNDYKFEKTYEDVRMDPFLIMHTSGTTGLPKAVVLKHGQVGLMDSYQRMHPIDGKDVHMKYWRGLRVYSAFPSFHSAGVGMNMVAPIVFGATNVFGPAKMPLNVDLVNSMLKYGNLDAVVLPPSIIEEMVRIPHILERMRTLKFVATGGGPLGKEAGDIVSTVTKVYLLMGTTEGSLLPTIETDAEDWDYFQFHPSAGFQFRETADDLFEMVQVKSSEPGSELIQGYFITFPDEQEVSTQDLYSRHPTKPHLWKHRGRADDIIVLSNGLKLNPLDMETTIQTHPSVRSAIVAGHARFQTSVLVELRGDLPKDEKERQSLMDELWTVISLANAPMPAHARLQPGFMIFAGATKPFPRAGKGTVQRSATVKLYEEELDQLYKNADTEAMKRVPKLDTSSLSSIIKSLEESIHLFIGKRLNTTEDFFAAGVDSLLVFQILRCLVHSLKTDTPLNLSAKLTTRLIYSNPTIDSLSRAYHSIIDGPTPDDGHDSHDELEEMQSLLKKYTSGLPQTEPMLLKTQAKSDVTVILTGSTGQLGTYILNALVKSPSVTRIYCLNRSSDGASRQHAISLARGLSTDWESGKVSFLQTNLSKPHLGLSSEDYTHLVSATQNGLIIHNQWEVNFALSLRSFETHIAGTRNLIDLAIKSCSSVFFVSSISVVGNWQSSSPVPEEPIKDLSAARFGYGRSKLIAEKILEEASRTSGLHATICRAGQIAGAVGSEMGLWKKTEWFPTIISTSASTGLLPSSIPSMPHFDFMPVNMLVHALLELAGIDAESSNSPTSSSFTSSPAPLQVYHASAPIKCTWSTDLLPTITSYLSSTKVVAWDEWLAKLSPEHPLLEFYRGLGTAERDMVELDTELATGKSATLRDMPGAGSEWMQRWMRQWGYEKEV